MPESNRGEQSIQKVNQVQKSPQLNPFRQNQSNKIHHPPENSKKDHDELQLLETSSISNQSQLYQEQPTKTKSVNPKISQSLNSQSQHQSNLHTQQNKLAKQQANQKQKKQKMMEQDNQNSQTKKFQRRRSQRFQSQNQKDSQITQIMDQTPLQLLPSSIGISTQSFQEHQSQWIIPVNADSTSATEQNINANLILGHLFHSQLQQEDNLSAKININLKPKQNQQNKLDQLATLLEGFSQNQPSNYQQRTNNNLIHEVPNDSTNFQFFKIGGLLIPKQGMAHNPMRMIQIQTKNLKDLKKQNKNSPEVAICLFYLGNQFERIHSYKKSRECFLQSMKICDSIINFSQTFENNKILLMKKEILGYLTQISIELKNSQQAIRYSDQAQIYAYMFDDQELMLKIKAKKSFIYRQLLWNFKKGNQILKEIILFCGQKFTNLPNHEIYVTSIAKLSFDYLQDGQYKQALQLSEKAIKICSDSLLYSWMQPLLLQVSGIAYLALGVFEKAKQKMEASINCYRNSNRQSSMIGRKYHFGRIYFQMGDFGKAEILYSQSLSFYMQQPLIHQQSIGIVQRNIGVLKNSQHQSDQSIVLSYFNKALECFDKQQKSGVFVQKVVTLNQRANTYTRFKKYNLAEKDFQQAFKMLQSKQMSQFTHAAKLYYDWASFFCLKKSYQKALKMVEHALKIWHTKFQPTHYQIRNAKDLKNKIMQNLPQQPYFNQQNSLKGSTAQIQLQELELDNSISRQIIDQEIQFSKPKSTKQQNLQPKQFVSHILSSSSMKSLTTSNKTKTEEKQTKKERNKQTVGKVEKLKQLSQKHQVISIKNHFYIPDASTPNSQIYYQTQIVGRNGKIIQKNLKATEVLKKGGEMQLVRYYETIIREKDKAEIQERSAQSDQLSESSFNEVSSTNEQKDKAEKYKQTSNKQSLKASREVNQFLLKGVELNKVANHFVRDKRYEEAEETYFQSMETFLSNDLFEEIEYGKLLFDVSQFELIRDNKEQALDRADISLKVLTKRLDSEHPALSQVRKLIQRIKNRMKTSASLQRERDQESRYITEGESTDVMQQHE